MAREYPDAQQDWRRDQLERVSRERTKGLELVAEPRPRDGSYGICFRTIFYLSNLRYRPEHDGLKRKTHPESRPR